MHLQCRVVPSDDARAALAVLCAHDLAEDRLIKGPRGDCTNEQHQEAVLGHLHLVLTLLHRSIDAKYHLGVVVDSVSLVVICEGVSCIDGEGGCGGDSGGDRWRRLCSGSGDILLGGLLCWNRLHRGRHGGVVIVVGGSIVGSGVGDGIGIVVIDALFVANDFIV